MVIFWFRRDLRVEDNRGLFEALESGKEVLPLFIFDKNILEKLDPNDRRVPMIFEALKELKQKLGKLVIKYGNPLEVYQELLRRYPIEAVYTNEDYENYALKRDQEIKSLLAEAGKDFHFFKDHIIFGKDEILNLQGDVYKVFTPYKRAWLEKLEEDPTVISDYTSSSKKIVKKIREQDEKSPSLEDMGFSGARGPSELSEDKAQRKLEVFLEKINQYKKARDFPAQAGTSRLSPDLRFGTMGVRKVVRQVLDRKGEGAQVWLSEIVWRDFYSMILANFPSVARKAFRPQYDKIKWKNDKKLFQAWCEGKTGFPIVDAGMRELNQTGLMHNRLRMITASFLCKTLRLDWRLGEAYFAKLLLDFDLASNNGGWQWSSSSGTDAAPYFRIFNPYLQSKKFDQKGEYLKKYCPELSQVPEKYIHDPTELTPFEQQEFSCVLGQDYPFPVVNYSEERQKTLDMYKEALG